MMTGERLPVVDFVKGIGIVLVVYGHVVRGIVGAGIPFDEHWFQLVDRTIYSFHMPLFFFLSGVLFHASFARKGKVDFVVGKLKTVAYPYLLWSILQGMIEFLLSRWTNGGVTAGDVFSLLWQPRAQFWFLYMLFFVFLIATFVYAQRSDRRDYGILLAALALYLANWSPIDTYVFNMFGFCFAYFALGVAFPHAVSWLGKIPFRLLSVALFVAASYFVQGIGGGTEDGGNLLKLLLALLGIVGSIELAGLALKMRINWIGMLGRYSLEIYLLHILVGSGIRIALQKVFGIVDPAVHLLLGTLLGLWIPLLIAYIAERSGVRWLFMAPKLKFALAR